MKRSTRVVLKYAGAIVGISVTVYLVWRYDLLATIGKPFLRWLLLVWEPFVVLAENIIRSLATRPFGRMIGWFFAGVVLRYILPPKMRALYASVQAWIRNCAQATIALWLRIPFAVKVLIIVGSGLLIAWLHIGLLLLPLGFFVEPIYRWFRNWAMREGVAGSIWMKKVANAIYRFVRHCMRISPRFRRILGPLRWVRLKIVVAARAWHQRYRSRSDPMHEAMHTWRQDEKQLDEAAKTASTTVTRKENACQLQPASE